MRCRNAVLAVVMALMPAMPPAMASDAPGKQQELKVLQTKIEKLRVEMAAAEANRSEASDALKASEQAISESNRVLHQLAASKAALSASLDELTSETTASRTTLDLHARQLARIAVHHYMHGSADLTRTIIAGHDFAALGRQAQYLGYVSRARASLVEQSRLTLARLSELQAETELKRNEIIANEASQLAASRRLEAERAVRRKVLASIAGDIARSRKEIGRLQRDQDRLSRLVERLGSILAPGTSTKGQIVQDAADQSLAGLAFKSLRGRLKLPARGELAGRFGGPRDESGATWKGLFIKTRVPQQVRAVADGRVVYADWFRGFGNLLIVDHGSGYMSLYGNNESVLRQVGQRVQSGEVVATSGDSGGIGESGVYFELRFQGKPFDPIPWTRR